jgi:hypothetical protein
MVFSTVLAYSVFVFTSLVLVFAIIGNLTPKSEVQKLREKLETYKTGRVMRTDWRKVVFFFLLWAVSGIYLFG